ncbi:MAG TPA: GNAT family N-acetyltransferase [Opitutaceae bacterium]|jgi:hypothetical protein
MPTFLDEQPATDIETDAEGILRVNPMRDPSWDANIALIPAATFFHTSAWASVLSTSFGLEPCYFIIEHQDGGRSILPMMEVDSWLTGRRGTSLPFTDECVPLVKDFAAFAALFHAAVQFGNVRRWHHLEIRGGADLTREYQPSVRFLGHTLNLIGNTPFANVAASVKQAVRKARRSGIIAESSVGERAMKEFYSLMCKTRQRHGLPPQPFRFFKAINEQIISRGKGLLMLARHGGRPVAGALFLIHGRKAIFKFGASDSGVQALRPNNLVMWNAISRLSQEGVESLDMGRTTVSNEGLRRFKLSWGAREREIEYFRFDLKNNSVVSTRDMSSGVHCRIFRALPLTISRAIGTLLYKHAA